MVTAALVCASILGACCVGAFATFLAYGLTLVVTAALVCASIFGASCVGALITFRTYRLTLVVSAALVFTSILGAGGIFAFIAFNTDAFAIMTVNRCICGLLRYTCGNRQDSKYYQK